MSANPKPAAAPPVKRIFLLDDHPLTRAGIRQLLDGEPDIKVCGEADTARQALTMVATLHPDMVLADITLPANSGLEFIKDMKAQQPDVPVLVLSMHDEKSYAERALRAGASGYIMKTEAVEHLLDAIRQVLQGQLHLSQRLSQTLLHRFAKNDFSRNKEMLKELTDREFEVYQLIGRGFGSKEISHRLCISQTTVESHRIGLKKKLKCKTALELNTHAMRWAASNQLI